jgi:hypothetical protein
MSPNDCKGIDLVVFRRAGRAEVLAGGLYQRSFVFTNLLSVEDESLAEVT